MLEWRTCSTWTCFGTKLALHNNLNIQKLREIFPLTDSGTYPCPTVTSYGIRITSPGRDRLRLMVCSRTCRGVGRGVNWENITSYQSTLLWCAMLEHCSLPCSERQSTGPPNHSNRRSEEQISKNLQTLCTRVKLFRKRTKTWWHKYRLRTVVVLLCKKNCHRATHRPISVFAMSHELSTTTVVSQFHLENHPTVKRYTQATTIILSTHEHFGPNMYPFVFTWHKTCNDATYLQQ